VTQGTRTVNVVNSANYPVSSITSDIASGLTLSSATYPVDNFGRITRTDYANGTYPTAVYGCCGPTEQVNLEGTATTIGYDAIKRVSYQTTDGITNLYTYDASGSVLTSTVKGRNNTELTTTNAYNAAGELVSSTTPDSKTTTYAVFLLNLLICHAICALGTDQLHGVYAVFFFDSLFNRSMNESVPKLMPSSRQTELLRPLVHFAVRNAEYGRHDGQRLTVLKHLSDELFRFSVKFSLYAFIVPASAFTSAFRHSSLPLGIGPQID